MVRLRNLFKMNNLNFVYLVKIIISSEIDFIYILNYLFIKLNQIFKAIFFILKKNIYFYKFFINRSIYTFTKKFLLIFFSSLNFKKKIL